MSNLDKYVGTSSPLDKYVSQNAPAAPAQPSSIWDSLAGGAKNVTDALGLHGAVDFFGDVGANLAHPGLGSQGYINQPDPLRAIGAGLSVGSTLASVAAPGAGSLVKSALQFGGLAAAQAGGSALAEGKDIGTVTKDAAISGAIGGATGGVFNLLGKGIKAAAPSVGSFTSGVPKAALEQTAKNPTAARAGLSTSVEQIRHEAVGSLQGLYKDLGSEFENGLDQVHQNIPISPKAATVPAALMSEAQSIASQFKVGTKATKEGLVADFSRSAIVKDGEVSAIQKSLDTISNWDDFSPKGMQTLSARIGALRNFDSGAQTRSSAIVGKIYKSVNDQISKLYPELSNLRSSFSKNKNVLDEISNVLSASKDSPVSVQSSITRLSNLFKTDREQYVNIIKQLGDRSGVDYLSLLAGTEAQKVLPGFIRGLGGGGSVAVGASVLNPYLLLLAPLFSPRAVGAVARNASGISRAVSPLIRTASTQTIPQLVGQ